MTNAGDPVPSKWGFFTTPEIRGVMQYAPYIRERMKYTKAETREQADAMAEEVCVQMCAEIRKMAPMLRFSREDVKFVISRALKPEYEKHFTTRKDF